MRGSFKEWRTILRRSFKEWRAVLRGSFKDWRTVLRTVIRVAVKCKCFLPVTLKGCFKATVKEQFWSSSS